MLCGTGRIVNELAGSTAVTMVPEQVPFPLTCRTSTAWAKTPPENETHAVYEGILVPVSGILMPCSGIHFSLPLGFIFVQFSHWDFTVPELNIYYYKAEGSTWAPRIPSHGWALRNNR